VAHRGWSSVYPENTMRAFSEALDLGVDALELDVHLTSDGKAVVIHDRLLDRTTDMTGAIVDMSLSQIRAADAGIRKGDEFAGERVPTLREVLDLAKDRAAVMVEMKPAEEGIVSAAAEDVEATGMSDQAILASFHSSHFRGCSGRVPNVERLKLGGDDSKEFELSNAHIAAPSKDEVNGKLVNDLHRQNIAVWVWTLDEDQDIETGLRLGADGIISNRPDRVLEIMKGHQ
jgi:glycerophosphoryl diester phosphodiesterase